MRQLKQMATLALTGILTIAPTWNAFAASGWVNEDKSWVYYDTNGTKHKGWIQTRDGYYYMDLDTGNMSIGWKDINKKWYYFKSSGLMNLGWIKDGNTWYYNLSDGVMVSSGWLKIDGNYYYMRSNGAMAVGWPTVAVPLAGKRLITSGIILQKMERWSLAGRKLTAITTLWTMPA